jgi:hypothetical protein
VRDNINVNSSLKLFESYRNFGGGINTQQSNEMIKDDHVIVSENVDLAWTQSIKRRYGRTAINSLPITDQPIQGLFTFVNNAETVLIVAIGGKLYYARPTSTSYGSWTQIPITDGGVSGFTFQETDCIEAVQYADWMYIATGTKLVRAQVYQDSLGVTQKSAETVVDQYKPTSQQALYVGLNSMNTTPSAFLVDNNAGPAGAITALGIYSADILLQINYNHQFTAYRTAPYSGGCDYQWSYKKTGDTTWIPFNGVYGSWVTGGNKTAQFIISEAGSYDIQVEMRLSASHTKTDSYELYSAIVHATPQQPILASTSIQRCRKCVLHWDRLILYDPKPSSTVGTSDERDHIFISDVTNLLYFPSANVISFAADTQQRVRKICRYRNILLIFTPDTIQSLTGTSPADYRRSLINNQIGALWSNSVQVVENQVFFVSKQGMYMINPNVYVQDNFNVISIDDHIKDQFSDVFITSDDIAASGLANSQVVSMVHNNQYWLYNYGSSPVLYRYYYKTRSWVVDTFDHIGASFASRAPSNTLYPASTIYPSNTTPTNASTVSFVNPIIASYKGDQALLEPAMVGGVAVIMGEDKSVYTDLGAAYTMKLTTKYFDLSLAFNYKKLRKLYIIARLQNEDINLATTVTADSAVILDPDVGTTVVDPLTGAVTWTTSTLPNINFYAGTYLTSNWTMGNNPLGDIQLGVLKTNLRAKCRRVQITFEHSEGVPCEIYGFGFEFRSKRP